MHGILCAFDVVVCAIFSSHHRNLFNAKICFMHSTITMTMLKIRIFYIYFPNQKLKLQVTAQTCWHWNIVPLFFLFFIFTSKLSLFCIKIRWHTNYYWWWKVVELYKFDIGIRSGQNLCNIWIDHSCEYLFYIVKLHIIPKTRWNSTIFGETENSVSLCLTSNANE